VCRRPRRRCDTPASTSLGGSGRSRWTSYGAVVLVAPWPVAVVLVDDVVEALLGVEVTVVVVVDALGEFVEEELVGVDDVEVDVAL
jgi:hypothetical protein